MTRDDGEGDVFVHQSDIYAEGFRSLREQEPVEFELEPIGDGRFKAVNVRLPPRPRRAAYRTPDYPEMRSLTLFFHGDSPPTPLLHNARAHLPPSRFPPLHRCRCPALTAPSFRGRRLAALTAGSA